MGKAEATQAIPLEPSLLPAEPKLLPGFQRGSGSKAGREMPEARPAEASSKGRDG